MANRNVPIGGQDAAVRDTLNRLTELLSRPSLPAPRLVADLFESLDGTAFTVEVPAPGLNADEIKITASGDMLTLEILPQIPVEQMERRYLLRELPREPLARVFTFPSAIDVDHVRARLEGGILRIHVPKAEGAPGRVVRVEQGQ